MRQTLALVLLSMVSGCGGGTAASSTSTTTTTATVTVNSPGAPQLIECYGRWSGVGTQLSGMEWGIEMTVSASAADGTCGTIEYPTLGCGGYVMGCTVLPDGRVYMRELYTHNPGTCAPAGEIVAVCAGGRMSWTWTGSGDAANATLSRL